MKGRGNKNVLRQNQIVSNKGYYTSPSSISVLSKQFGITGNLNVTSSIRTDILNVSTSITTNFLNVSTILLNGNNTNIYTENNDLYLSAPALANSARVFANNIQITSTITNNIILNLQKPIRIYADNNDKFVFNATGEDQYFIVPSGVSELNVKLWGAAGYGRGLAYSVSDGGGSLGGFGGYVSGLLPVTPGEELVIVVGKQGTSNSDNAYGGGGRGGHSTGGGGGGGGGRSAIMSGIDDLVTSGGGGGGASGNIYCWGGVGGNYSGQSGQLFAGLGSVGTGGTQTEAGNYGGNYTDGGDAVDGTFGGGGGGGGGWYGGGGGLDEGGAGGGGSSYLDGLSNAVGIAGNNYATYITDPDYINNAGLNDGLVVISYPTNLQLEYTDPLAKIGVSRASVPRNGWVAGGAGANYGGNYNPQYSLDGLTWISVRNANFPGPTNGIAYSGSQWAAVFSLSTINYVATGATSTIQISTDGIRWSQINTGGFSNGYGIVYGSTIWTAVGEKTDTNTSIQTSVDGLNWTNTNNPFTDIGYGVSFNGIFWVAVGKSSTNDGPTIKFCLDGSNWNDSITGGFTSAPVASYYNTYYPDSNGINVANNNFGVVGQLWVAVGSGTTPLGTIQYSTDGSNWNDVATGGFIGFGRGVAYGNGIWVATGDSSYNSTEPLQTIQWSIDGINWNNSITGGFDFSGTSVSFNGKTWIATGSDTQQNNFIQTSFDGSNWSGVDSVTSLASPNCVTHGVLDVIIINQTFLTNNEVTTNTFTGNYVNSTSINGNYVTASTITVGNYLTTNLANVSSLSANYGNIGDFYVYSYVKDIIKVGINDFVAIGTSKKTNQSIQWSKDGIIWYGVNSGGFSPTITYGQTRITNSTEPKALLYNPSSNNFVAYGITDEFRKTNNLTNTVQYSDSNDISTWNSYAGVNTITKYILENINTALYTHDKYMLLTSVSESPILISDSMAQFYLGPANNKISYSNSTDKTSSLSVAYGFYQSTNTTFIVGTACNFYTGNGNSPIFYTRDGSNLYSPPNIQANLPPTFYDLTMDTTNNILFAVGPGIPDGTTSLSTFMYSIDGGTTWEDGGLEGVISARSVSFSSTITNNVIVACESTTSSNTVITYSYTGNAFTPYVPNTLTNNTRTMLYSTDNGSNWLPADSGGFSNVGYNVLYDTDLGKWYSVGSDVSTLKYSVDGSNWSNINGGFDTAGYGLSSCPISFGGYIILVSGSDTRGSNLQFIDNNNDVSEFDGTFFDTAGYGIYSLGQYGSTVAVGVGLNSGTILCGSLNGPIRLSNSGITDAFDIAGYGITYGNNLWVAVGKGVTTSNILYSKNGFNWSNAAFGPFDVEGQGIVYRDVPQSTLWVAVGSGVTTSNILYSSDGSNWFNSRSNTFSNTGYGVTWNGTNFVAVGDSGILISPDGSNWSLPVSGNFNTQTTSGSGTITIAESYGRGVASGPGGLLVAVGRAESTNRQYNWLTVNQVLGNTLGFSSVISEDGNTIEPTYIATKAIYDQTFGQFIVGGLANNPLNSIINSQDANINVWGLSQQNYFDGISEKQFVNSLNRTVVSEELTTNNLYTSNINVYNSLTVNKNIFTKNLNASNILTLNISSSNIYTPYISTNILNTSNINSDIINANNLSSAIIEASLINVSTINFSNHVGINATITNLIGTTAYINNFSTNTLNADFFTGNGSGLTNVTANGLVDTGSNTPGYTISIPNTNIVASNITGNFSGTFSGTVTTTGPLSDDIINADTINVSTLNTLGDIFLGNNGIRNGIINGNGSGLSNVVASSLVATNNQVITGNFTANDITAARFIGDGSSLTNLPSAAVAAAANFATTAGSATNATNAVNATYASYGRLDPATGIGFDARGIVVTKGLRLLDSGGLQVGQLGGLQVGQLGPFLQLIGANSSILCQGPIQARTVTTTSDINSGGRITGTNLVVYDKANISEIDVNVAFGVNCTAISIHLKKINLVSDGTGGLYFIKDGTSLSGTRNRLYAESLGVNGTISINNNTINLVSDGTGGLYFINVGTSLSGTRNRLYAKSLDVNDTIFAKRYEANGGNMTARTGAMYDYRNDAHSSSYQSINWIPNNNNGNTYDTTSQGACGIICSAQVNNARIEFCVTKNPASFAPIRIGYFDVDGLVLDGILSINNKTINLVSDGTGGLYFINVGTSLSGTRNRLYAASFNTSSDKRIKTNIEPLTNVLSSIKKLRGVKYNLKNSSNNKKSIGLIAQELEEVFPEFVSTDNTEEKMKSIEYGNITAVLIEAIKEQQKLIESQQATINALLKKYPL